MRHGKGGSAAIRLRTAGALLLLMHLLIVGWVALSPVDAPWVTAANLRPFAGISADFAVGTLNGVASVAKGLALLAPLGVLLPVVSGRLWVSPYASLARTLGAGLLISLAIEILKTGMPGRMLDVDALILNSLGVALAHVVVVPLGRARIRRALRAAAAARAAGAVAGGGAGASTGSGAGGGENGGGSRSDGDLGGGDLDGGSAAGPGGAAEVGTRPPRVGQVNGYVYGVVAPRVDVYDPDAVPEGDGPEGSTPTIPRVGLAP